MLIGKALRLLREQRGLSLRQLARLSGLSHSFICDIERGRGDPSLRALKALAAALEVDPGLLIGPAKRD